MPDANSSDEAVLARLRSVLPADEPATPRSAPATVHDPTRPATAAADPTAVAGTPPPAGPPWLRPVRPPAAAPARPVGGDGGGAAGSWSSAGAPTMAEGRLGGLGAFDPGRRGAKALAAVTAVVVLVAALLAWRARPRTEPVSADGAVPADTRAATTGTGGPSPAGDPSGAGTQAPGAAPVVVAVGGKVRRPGLVRLAPGSRVADALQAAGGADGGVDVALLNLARRVVDGELILVGVTPPPGASVPAGGAPAGGAARPPGAPVNINTATAAELDTLPGVGPVLAQRIVDHREQHGAFTAVSDLRTVEGIGGARYDQLKDLVTV